MFNICNLSNNPFQNFHIFFRQFNNYRLLQQRIINLPFKSAHPSFLQIIKIILHLPDSSIFHRLTLLNLMQLLMLTNKINIYNIIDIYICRVLEGEGEFAGEGAYEEFKRLATVFYGEVAGVLVHPVWMTTRAYFTELEVVQEPVPDYVRYRFAFCEAGSEGAALKEVSTSAAGGSAAGTAGARYHTVVQGDTLWAIAARNGTTVRALCALNPQIANPNRIYPGERVSLS